MKITLLLTKTLVGLLLSSALAFGFYFLSIPLITSIWKPEVINGVLITIVTTGIGSSIGGFIGWFDPDHKILKHAALYAIALTGALIGAYIGIQQGIRLEPFQEPWRYGLPVLSLTIRGAVIGANAPLLMIWAFDNLRGRWHMKKVLKFRIHT